MTKIYSFALLALTAVHAAAAGVVAKNVDNVQVSSAPAASATPPSQATNALCQQELTHQKVYVTKPVGNNGIRLDNVPSACMEIASSVLAGAYSGGPPPTQVDGDSILYDELEQDEYDFLSGVFDGWVASQSNLMKRNLEPEDQWGYIGGY